MPVDQREAVEIFATTVRPLGLAAEERQQPGGPDLVLLDAEGHQWLVEVKSTPATTPEQVSRIIARWERTALPGTLRVLVADRIPDAVRAELRSHGWGWLDLRGHLRLAGSGVLVDVDVPPVRSRPGRADAFSGQAGLEVACSLLLRPSVRQGVREVARELGRSPSTVSEVLGALRAQGLVADGLPVTPDLFWETASAWRPPEVPLADAPRPGTGSVNAALQLGFEDVEAQTGWALTDTLAAATYGAPIAARSDYPPDFYVPSQETLRRAVRLLGAATDAAQRRARVRVAPVPVICRHRVDPAGQEADPAAWGSSSQHWPLANPLFVALDLARDPGRGREVLDSWNPPQPWPRVW